MTGDQPTTPIERAGPDDLAKMGELLAFIGKHLPSLPWSVHGEAGKPVIAGAKSGNLFYGYIATWQEAELLCLVVNSLPAMLAEIEQHRRAATPTTPTAGEDAVERAVRVCPQCEGEGSYADGLDEAACSTDCTRCGTNGWIVDTAALAAQEPSS